MSGEVDGPKKSGRDAIEFEIHGLGDIRRSLSGGESLERRLWSENQLERQKYKT